MTDERIKEILENLTPAEIAVMKGETPLTTAKPETIPTLTNDDIKKWSASK